ncbi:MAG: LytR/AlgR family response regulator transcription factor [Bacteroidia bacterium]
MNSIIIDDDKLSQNAIGHLAAQLPFLKVSGIFGSALEATTILNSGSIDLMFLDIELPDITGLEFMGTLQNPPLTILITSKKEYALEAFEYNVVDYIVKPVAVERFLKAVTKARITYDASGRPADSSKDHLFIKVNGTIAKIDVKDILWIEALGDYITIHTSDKKYTVHSTLKAVEARLDPDRFLRVHRSYIISVGAISSIDDSVVSINKQLIPIGAVHRDNFRKRLNLL